MYMLGTQADTLHTHVTRHLNEAEAAFSLLPMMRRGWQSQQRQTCKLLVRWTLPPPFTPLVVQGHWSWLKGRRLLSGATVMVSFSQIE